jgi:hypothetical protein
MGWVDPVDIALADSDLLITLPRVSLSAAGSGAAIWAQGQTSGAQIWANRYDGPSASWREASQLSTSGSATATFPQIAVDPAGDGFAMWSELVDTSRVLWASRLQADVGFLPGVQLASNVTAATPQNAPAQIAVDPQGNAVVVWDALDAGAYDVWIRNFE